MLYDSMVTSAARAWVLLSALAVQVHIPFASATEPQSSPSHHEFEAPGIPEAQPWKYRTGGAQPTVQEIMEAYDSSVEKEPLVPFAMGRLRIPTPTPTITLSEEILDDKDNDKLEPHRFIPVKIEQHHKESSQPPHHRQRPGVVPAPKPVTPRPADSNLLDDAEYDREHEQEILYRNYLTAREAKYIHHPIVEDRDPGIIRVDRVDYPYDHRSHHNHLNLVAGNEFRRELTDDKYARPVIQNPPRPKPVSRPRPDSPILGPDHDQHSHHNTLNLLADAGNEFQPELSDDKYARPVIQKPPRPPKPVNRPRPESPIFAPDYSGSCGAVEYGSGCGFVSLAQAHDKIYYGQEHENVHGLVSRDDHDGPSAGGELTEQEFQTWHLGRDKQGQQGYLADVDSDSEDSELAGFELDSDSESDSDIDSEAEVEFNTPAPKPEIQSRDIATPEEQEHLELLSEATNTNNLNLNLQGDVASCTRSKGRLHTQRKWSITYKGDSQLNPKHCGKSVLKHLKWKLRCKPITDWTCVKSGKEGEDQVTVGFHTPRTCKDKLVHDAVKKGTKGKVDVWCKHE